LESPFQNEAGATINGELLPRVRAGGGEAALQSYFGLLNYSFRNRYFISANIRRDGSSRFGADRRFATFGGIGAAWVMSDEAFMAGTRGWLNLLKVKASYGTVGNQEGIGFYESQGTVSGRTQNAAQGTIITVPTNRELQWEERAKFNTGIEFGLFNNKLTGGIEYYNEVTGNSSLFLPVGLSLTTGFRSITKNIGSVRNSGVEIALNYDIIRNKDMRLSINGNITFNKNEIVKLAERDTIVSGRVIRTIGQPINSIFLVEYAGVNPDNGNAQYRNLDGSLTETYDPFQRTIVGNQDPTYFGGYGFDFSYKGIGLNGQFSFFGGQELYNNERNNIENPDYFYDNMNEDLMREWQKPGDITNIPRPDNPYNSETTRFVENAAFTRLRNVTLSYTLPTKLSTAATLKSVMFYVMGTNLFTLTQFRGRDPEFAGGVSQTGAQYPAMRTVQAGIRVGF
jgi:TonB-linked SusC/RagA family outer membrane protein